MSEPICYVMIGLPALGKSTHIEGMYKPDTFIYSTDRYIENVASANGKTYNDVFSDTIAEATENMNNFLQYAIEDRLDIIWDQTNLGVGKRKRIIDRMKQVGYQVRAICLMPPESGHISDQKDWKHRLKSRPGKVIPDEVLSDMYRSFTVPTVEEGFDMISFYSMHGALLGIDLCEEDF